MDPEEKAASVPPVEMFSNVQPPRARRYLTLLSVSGTAKKPGHDVLDQVEPGLGMAGKHAGKFTTIFTTGSKGCTSTPKQVADLEANLDAIVTLASTELSARVRTSAGAWTEAGGIPSAEVRMWLSDSAAAADFTAGLPPRPPAACLASVNAVPATIRKRPPGRDGLIWAAVSFPQLLYGFGLGLRKSKPRQDYTCMVLDVVPMVVTTLVQALKYATKVPRPRDYPGATGFPADVDWPPVIKVPLYSSYPGGHATTAYALATVLQPVTGVDATALSKLAGELSLDRESAGLHTGIDTAAGRAIGEAVGKWMVQAAGKPLAFPIWSALFCAATQEWK